MTGLLLANVGNRDVVLTDRSRLPQHEDPRWWDSPRRLGEEIAANLDRYDAALELPLLHPTLDWLLNEQGIAADDLQVVLFASDQPHHLTLERDWLKDTAPFAQVIRELLEKRYKIPKRFVKHIEGSPADYANMLAFYLRTLPQIAAKAPPDSEVFLEVSGGTPAMSSMLIVAGVEVFGDRVHTLYLEQDARHPSEIGVAQQLFARKSRETLLGQIELYAYNAALQTVEQSGRLIAPDNHRRDLLACLLSYADRRLAFDFRRARNALHGALALTTGNTQAQIRYWLRELQEPTIADNLSEVIHSAAIKLQLGEYADLVQRVFRFQEASFRYLAEQMGMQYKSSKSDEFLDEDWRKSLPALDNYLRRYRRGYDGRKLAETDRDIEVITTRSLNRFSLGAIVEYFVEHEPRWKPLRAVVDRLFSLSAVADLRNKGLSGHGFNGIGREDLEAALGDGADMLIDRLRRIYTEIFEGEPGEDPYRAVNTLLVEVIEAPA